MAPTNVRIELDLVARAQEGSALAQGQLFARHARELLPLLTRLLSSTQSAADALADTFVEAFAGLPELLEPRVLGGWLRHLAVDQAQQRFDALLLRRLALGEQAADATMAALARADLSPRDRAALQHIDVELQRGPARERAAWMLRYVEGYELADVAAACDCSVATATAWIDAMHTRITRGACSGGDKPTLPMPLKRALRDPSLDDESIERLWEATQERLARPVPRWRVIAQLATMGVVALAVLVVLFVRPWRAPALLLRSDGQPLSTMVATAPATVMLSDGNAIALDAGARLEPMADQPGLVTFRLDAGRVRFAVAAGSERRWTVDAGLATIDFTGATFTAQRADGVLELHVTDGAVVVRGKTVPNGEQQIGAGASIRVGRPRVAAAHSYSP